MSQKGNNCPTFFDCDNKPLSLEQVLRMLVIDDGNGCPTLKVNASISGTGGTGATEATLQGVLASLNNGKEFETVLVKDLGNSNLIVRQVITFDTDSNTFNLPIYYTIAGVLYSPLGVLEYIDNSLLLQNILTQITSVNRSPIISESIVNGNTPTNIISLSILFRGDGGTLGGVSVPNGYSVSYGNNKDIINTTIPYTVPTSGEQRILITTLS